VSRARRMIAGRQARLRRELARDGREAIREGSRAFARRHPWLAVTLGVAAGVSAGSALRPAARSRRNLSLLVRAGLARSVVTVLSSFASALLGSRGRDRAA